MDTDARATILCVDDDGLFLNAVTRALARKGYHVIPCETPQRALEALSRGRPDAAIVDVMMPGMDGLELTERIQRLSKAQVPVILLSAAGGDAAVGRGMRSGARFYLTKPCPMEHVFSAVEAVLDKRPAVPAQQPSIT